jgi:hypothetical protein
MAPCQNYIHVQASTAAMNKKPWHSKCHYRRNSGSPSAGTNNPTPGGGPAEQKKTDEWRAVTCSSSSDDDDFCSGGQTAAALTSWRVLLPGGPRSRPNS